MKYAESLKREVGSCIKPHLKEGHNKEEIAGRVVDIVNEYVNMGRIPGGG